MTSKDLPRVKPSSLQANGLFKRCCDEDEARAANGVDKSEGVGADQNLTTADEGAAERGNSDLHKLHPTAAEGGCRRQSERSWLDDKQRLNTREAAQYTGIPIGTLRKFRSEGRGPIYSKPAGRALYDKRDLDAFLASGLRFPSVHASKERERNVAV